jgi:hypothetical protein
MDAGESTTGRTAMKLEHSLDKYMAELQGQTEQARVQVSGLEIRTPARVMR